MNKFLSKKNKGFTLVESLVAISIFSVSILGLMSVLSDGISNTVYAKDKMIATYLAQEGVEYIRNMRDTYVLFDPVDAGAGWTSFNTKLTTASCNGVNGCYLDNRNVNYSAQDRPMTNLLLTACSASNCPDGSLLYDSSSGKYGYVSGSSSHFTRQIKTVVVSANETKVFSTIYWNKGSVVNSITFSDNLFNWVE